MKNNKEIVRKLKKEWGKESLILKNLDDNRFKYVESRDDCYCVLMKNPDILEDVLFFGFISFPNNLRVVEDLFKKMELSAKSFSEKKLVGPINFSTWFSYRWMTKGFNKTKVYNEPSNQEYVPDFARKFGFKEYARYYSTLVKSNDIRYGYYKDKYKKILKKGYSFKRYSGLKIYFALRYIYEISIDSFFENPFYSSISFKDFKSIYVSGFNNKVNIQPVVDLCFYKKEPVGFLFTFKNHYSDDILVWKTIGIKRKYQNNNIGSAFRFITHKTALEKKCSNVLYHLTYEKNIVRNFINDGKILKEYALFFKNI